MVVFHYDGILRSVKEYAVYIWGERRVGLVYDYIFDRFESQIKRISGSGPSSFKIVYSLKFEAISVCTKVCAQEDLMSCMFSWSSVYVIKSLVKLRTPSPVETKERYVPNLNDAFSDH